MSLKFYQSLELIFKISYVFLNCIRDPKSHPRFSKNYLYEGQVFWYKCAHCEDTIYGQCPNLII